MPTGKLEIGQRCRTLSGSGVPGFIQTGLIYWDFACKGSRGGGDQWKRKEENISVLYKTYPASRLFPQFGFCSTCLLFLFKLWDWETGKGTRGGRARRGRWYETRQFLYYFFVPPIRERFGDEYDVLGSHLLRLDKGD